MSEINVNTIDKATGSTLNVGAAGTTVNIAGTAGTGFPAGVSLNGSTNNTVATVTGANALEGEAQLLFDGTNLTVGAAGAGLGKLAISTADSGASAHADANELVMENAGASGLSILSFNNNYGNIYFGDGQDNDIGQISYNHTTNSLEFLTNTSLQLKIDSSGNVGIGETSPLGKLHVKTADSGASVNASADEIVIEGSGDSGMTILSGNGGNGNVNFGDDGSNLAGRIQYQHGSNYMMFATNATERYRVTSAGEFYINTTASVADGFFTLKFPDQTRRGMVLYGTDDDATMNFMQFNAAGTECGRVQRNGSNTVSFTTSSDYRLKENETPITDGITRLKTLKPYRFNFKADPDKTVDGFFAHEVSGVIPEAIQGEKDAMHPEVLYDEEILYTNEDELPEGKNIGDVKHSIGDVKEATKINPQGIDQSKLVPLLTKALQEAITKIETLETKVTALENA